MKKTSLLIITQAKYLLLASLLIFGCGDENKDKRLAEEQAKIAKEEEEKIAFSNFLNTLQSKHDAIFLDSLFKSDSSKLTYSFLIEEKLTKSDELILARCIILDILRLSDSTYLLMSATPFKKANNINGFFYSELMCSQNIVNKIVNTKLNSHMPAYVFLVVKYDYYKTIDFSNSVDGNGEESYDYDINFEYTYAHRAVGTCFDIEYDPQFDGFLDSY